MHKSEANMSQGIKSSRVAKQTLKFLLDEIACIDLWNFLIVNGITLAGEGECFVYDFGDALRYLV